MNENKSSFLFQARDISSMVFFRIVFGILAFLDVLVTWIWYHLTKDSFNPDNYQFKYIGFEWVIPFSEPFMSIFFFILMILAVLITLGYKYRLSCFLFACGFSYLFLLEKAHYLNHAYLFCVLSFVMAFLPANRAFSYDVVKGWSKPATHIPNIALLILKFLMGTVYFFGGIAKINADWLNAMPLKLWLPAKKNMPIIGPLLEQEWLAWFMSYGGLMLDLFVVPLLLFKKTRWIAFGLATFFHLTNTAIFKIGIFPWLSIALTALFFEANFPTKIINFLKNKSKLIAALSLKYTASKNETLGLVDHTYIKPSSKTRKLILCILIPFCLLNMMLPLRHHFFKGQVSWTEEGHKYAWRMMLRSKRASGYFSVVNVQTGESIKVKPSELLKPKQKRKLMTHPDMIWQFSQHLKEKYSKEWNTNEVQVFAKIRAKLHDRKYQEYIDPTIDLTKVEWKTFQSSPWIVPLEEK